jgi:hypothetical protein
MEEEHAWLVRAGADGRDAGPGVVRFDDRDAGDVPVNGNDPRTQVWPVKCAT